MIEPIYFGFNLQLGHTKSNPNSESNRIFSTFLNCDKLVIGSLKFQAQLQPNMNFIFILKIQS